MRTKFFTLILLSAICATRAIAVPDSDALKNWRAHTTAVHPETLVVHASYQRTIDTLLATIGSGKQLFELEACDRVHGEVSTAWRESEGYPPSYDDDGNLTHDGLDAADFMRNNGHHPALLEAPDCDGCLLSKFAMRMVLKIERVSANRTRLIAHNQYIGYLAGIPEPFEMRSTGLLEKGTLATVQRRLQKH